MCEYKEHLATDADSELITAVAVTTGNVADSGIFEPLGGSVKRLLEARMALRA